MALPAGVTQLGTFKGDKGDKGAKGDTGVLAFLTAESVPADQAASVEMLGPEWNRGAHLKVPRGLPGVLAVDNDEAVAAYVAATDSQTRAALDSRFATVVNVADPTVAKVQAAVDAAVSAGVHTKITTPGDAVIRMGVGESLVIDASFVTVDFQGATLDASLLTSGAAVVVGGSVYPPYGQSTHSISNLRVVGSGRTNGVTGIAFTDALQYSSSHMNHYNLSVSGFETGLLFGENAYVLNFFGCDVWNCGTGLRMPAGFTDYGERLTFVGCTIYNNNLNLYTAHTAGAFHMIACSFDYSTKQFDIRNGRVFLHACHVEANVSTYPAPPISITGNGATFVMTGGWMLCTGSGTMTASYVVENNASGKGGVWFTGVSMNNLRTATDRFATGTGRTMLRGTSSYAQDDIARIVSDVNTPVIDGGFAESTIVDEIWISADSAPITDQFTGANIALSLDSSQARSGTQSLKAQKTSGAGSNAQFIIAAPIERNCFAALEVWWKKAGANSGTVYCDFRYAAVKRSATTGLPSVVKSSSVGTSTINLTGSATEWGRIVSGYDTPRAPEWATHFYVQINMNSFVGPGAIHFDDINVSIR